MNPPDTLPANFFNSQNNDAPDTLPANFNFQEVPVETLQPKVGYFQDIGNKFVQGSQDIGTSFERGQQMAKKGDFLGGLTRSFLGGAGGASRAILSLTKPAQDLLGFILKPITDPVTGQISKNLSDEKSQQTIQVLAQKVNDWTQKHPDDAANIKDIVDTGNLLLQAYGAGKTVNQAKEVFDIAKRGVGELKQGFEYNKTQSLIKKATPKINELTPTARKELLYQQNIIPETRFTKGKINLTPDEESLIKANPELFKGKTVTDNVYNVSNRIAENDMAVKSYADEVGATFDKQELKQQILKATKDITDPINSEAFDKAKERTVDSIIKTIPSENTSDLITGRQVWDKANKAKLDSLFAGRESSKGTFAKAVRDAMNESINNSIDDDIYKGIMKQSSGLINLRDGKLIPMATKRMTQSGLSQFLSRPGVKQAAGAAKLGGIIEGVNILGH